MATYRLPDLSRQGTPVPPRNLAQYTRSFQRAVYGYVMPKIDRFCEEHGMTQKAFAAHLDIDPGQMNRTLAEPQNWTLDTVAKLLIGTETDPREILAVPDPVPAHEAGRSITREHETAPLAAEDATRAHDAAPANSNPLFQDRHVDLARYLAPPERTSNLEKLLEVLGSKSAEHGAAFSASPLSIAKLQTDLAASLAISAESSEIGRVMAELEKSTAWAREHAAVWSTQFNETVLQHIQQHIQVIDIAAKAGTVEREFARALLEVGASQWHSLYDSTQRFTAATTYDTDIDRGAVVAGMTELLTRMKPEDAPIKLPKMPPSSGARSSVIPRKQPRSDGAQGNKRPGLRRYREVA